LYAAPQDSASGAPARTTAQPLVAPVALNTSWALDFMVDTRYDGRRFRTLNLIDASNREGLAIEIGTTCRAFGSSPCWRS
jgi:hypothetical protein